MKKYNLGRLKVTDKKLLDREEIIIEAVDRVGKLSGELDKILYDSKFSNAEKVKFMNHTGGVMCGISEFIRDICGLEIRDEDGRIFSDDYFGKLQHHQLTAVCDLKNSIYKIFKDRVQADLKRFDSACNTLEKQKAAAAIDAVVTVYAELKGISYDDASAELHERSEKNA